MQNLWLIIVKIIPGRVFAILSCLAALSLAADEGMWPFDKIPTAELQKHYDACLKQEDLDHLRLSCLRLSAGGSASFVSPNGLVMTNHHVSFKTILDLSSAEKNYLDTGFYAPTFADELCCPNLFADQLCEIKDVTDEILKVLLNAGPSERGQAYHECVGNIIKQAKEATGLQPEIVSLYNGACYHLYLYRRYTDIRLVMAPESSIAYFGGEDENFEFPRHCLDVCFLRIYEDGKPLCCDHYLPWSQSGPCQDELLFVAGHPGKTERQTSAEHLQFLKNCKLPLTVQFLQNKITALTNFAEIDAEHERIASSELRRSLNSLKVFAAQLSILESTPLITEKMAQQRNFADPIFWKNHSNLYGDIEKEFPAFFYFEGPGSHYSHLFRWARLLVRTAAERNKPDNERLREYKESALPTLELDLFSEEPVYSDFENFSLQNSLAQLEKVLGNNYFGSMAYDAIALPSQLVDISFRKYLYENPSEIALCRDPLILLALECDPYSRQLRQKMEQKEAALRDSYTQIAQALRLYELTYPDATFTLRLSFGQMLGYSEKERQITAHTTFGSAFTHSNNYNLSLPKSWQDNSQAIDPQTPFNFVSTHDIIGGNSGSPMVNLAGEVVGLIFDGNAQSLAWDLAFDQQQGRAISVHSQAIVEALDKIYNAKRIVEEIKGYAKSLPFN